MDRAGIAVIGVHTAGERLENVGKAVQESGLGYPICIDVKGGAGHINRWGRTFGSYGVVPIPFSVLVDSEGRVAAHGYLLHEILAQARKLAAPTPPATQPGGKDGSP